jgi:hypothetical protein
MVATVAPRSFNRCLGNCPVLDGNGYATNTKFSPVLIVKFKRTAQVASAVIHLAAIARLLIGAILARLMPRVMNTAVWQ